MKKPLTYLINLPMLEGVFPDKLIQLLENGGSFLCTNYLAILLLSCFHKVFFMKMRNSNILYRHRYGFRKTFSTNLSLIEAVDEIYSNLIDGLSGNGIYLDLQKAFDTVNRDILLKNLNTTEFIELR